MDGIAAVRAQFEPTGTYLNTASIGLPCRETIARLQTTLERWQSGIATPAEYDDALTRCRALYAQLVGASPSDVAVGPTVSVFAGLIASNLPDGSEVLTAQGDFTSILFPFYAQGRRGITVREVPLEELPNAITSSTTLVAVSAVQSADGRVADLDALEAAAQATGTRVLLDTTQSAGWLPIDVTRFAYTTGSGYKWLLAPRGTAYLTVQHHLVEELIPNNANWYAGHEPWSTIYGSPLRLAADARRFDISPAWHSWIGQEPGLELLLTAGPENVREHVVGLANRFRNNVGAEAGQSAIMSLAVKDGTTHLLESAQIGTSIRAGRTRLSFHLYNDEADVDRASEVLRDQLLDLNF